MSSVKTILRVLLALSIVYASINIMLSSAGLFLGSKYPLVVVEGISMEPTYYGGDLLFVKEVANKSTIKYPDIIVFYEPISGTRLIVHRVITQVTLNGQIGFITKGDNNAINDRWTVRETDIIGVVVGRIQSAGSIVFVMQSQTGKIFTAALLIIIVGLNIIYEKDETVG